MAFSMTNLVAAGSFTLQSVTDPASDAGSPAQYCVVKVQDVKGCTGQTDWFVGNCGDMKANNGQDTRQACGNAGIRINWGVPNVPIDFVNSAGDRTSCNLGGNTIGTTCSPP